MGCDIASCTAAAGSTSSSDIERIGFRQIEVDLSFGRVDD
jgi:hypothetical protein